MRLPQEETAGDLENERTRVQWDSHALSDDEHDDMGEECVQATTLCSHGVRIATIDNFQGEENQIIIVSLVRSNPKHIPGFLKVQNRVNVLLSRAKHAQYIIGNRETVRSSSCNHGKSLWICTQSVGQEKTYHTKTYTLRSPAKRRAPPNDVVCTSRHPKLQPQRHSSQTHYTYTAGCNRHVERGAGVPRQHGPHRQLHRPVLPETSTNSLILPRPH
jgi:hypothetical protein